MLARKPPSFKVAFGEAESEIRGGKQLRLKGEYFRMGGELRLPQRGMKRARSGRILVPSRA